MFKEANTALPKAFCSNPIATEPTMNPYMHHLTAQTAPADSLAPRHAGRGHTWEMMISEAAYKAFIAIERAKDAIFARHG